MRRVKSWTTFGWRWSRTQLFMVRSTNFTRFRSEDIKYYTFIYIRNDFPGKRGNDWNRLVYTEYYATQKEAIVGHKRALKAALELERRLADGKRSHRSRGAWSRRLADRGQLLARTITQTATRRTSPQ